MSSEDQSREQSVYRIGIAPIAEPEEVTDVSVQASCASIEAGVPARDEPDVHVHMGPDRLFQQLRDVVRRPVDSVREKLGWPGKNESSSKPSTDRFRAIRRFRHRFCPPFRVVAEDDASVAQESELLLRRR